MTVEHLGCESDPLGERAAFVTGWAPTGDLERLQDQVGQPHARVGGQAWRLHSSCT